MSVLTLLIGVVIGMVIGGQWQAITTLNRVIDVMQKNEEDDEWAKLLERQNKEK